MEQTQKSYKEYVFYDSLKKGLIKECLNPTAKTLGIGMYVGAVPIADPNHGVI